VWIAGGGSGHGFKMGPVVGEVIARAVLAGGPVPAEWRLTRFSAGERDAGGKWS
jgi:sarcosine oxidase